MYLGSVSCITLNYKHYLPLIVTMLIIYYDKVYVSSYTIAFLLFVEIRDLHLHLDFVISWQIWPWIIQKCQDPSPRDSAICRNVPIERHCWLFCRRPKGFHHQHLSLLNTITFLLSPFSSLEIAPASLCIFIFWIASASLCCRPRCPNGLPIKVTRLGTDWVPIAACAIF